VLFELCAGDLFELLTIGSACLAPIAFLSRGRRFASPEVVRDVDRIAIENAERRARRMFETSSLDGRDGLVDEALRLERVAVL
jgi:hypothetical protein